MPTAGAIATDAPRTVCLRAPRPVRFASSDDDGAPRRRVQAVIYSGDAVWDKGVRKVIDLEMLEVGAPKPMTLDHGKEGASSRIGVWSELRVERDASGMLSLVGLGSLLTNEAALSVASDADDGYPFEASGWFDVEWSFVPEGERVQVNGRTIQGPVLKSGRGSLREGCLTTVGVDAGTKAAIFAAQASNKGQTMAEDTTTRDDAKPDAPTEEAQMQEDGATVAVEDITADWLRENMPDLVEALIEAAGEGGGEGAEPAPSTETMAAEPAQLSELKALAPDHPALVIDAFEAKMTTAQFSATLAAVNRAESAAAGAGVAPAEGDPAQTGQTAPARFSAEAGTKEVYEANDKVRERFKTRGGFERWCQAMERNGEDLNESLAAIGC